MAVQSSSIKTSFFEYLFGDDVGFLCIARGTPGGGRFVQEFFRWPSEKQRAGEYIAEWENKQNVWFCTSLLKDKQRTKDNCLPSNIVWADLDYVSPDGIEPIPSCVLETSPGRYQAFWRLNAKMPTDVIEDFSKRITYATGADKGGWALTKMMRVPTTVNHKYEAKPKVEIRTLHETLVPVGFFEEISPPQGVSASAASNGDVEIVTDVPMPEIDKLPDVQHVIYKYKAKLVNDRSFAGLLIDEPSENEDWSARLWRLINLCFEAGMDAEETFTVALASNCNKYQRDNRPYSYLWRDVLKAQARQQSLGALQVMAGIKPLTMPQLVDPDMMEDVAFLKDYKQWALKATDAPAQYHELSAFIGLSAIVCQGLRLEASFGMLRPHLWGLVLGESTLTRKTTAMDMMVNILLDLDSEIIVASDGSVEGILSAISLRPKRVSMFFRDEVSGLFDAMNKKDYLAGLAETFTKMYDVPKFMPRQLRKETINIAEPYFIFFGGGIRDKVYSLLSEDYVISGFLPRFLVVSGENDLSRLQPTGPPTAVDTSMKDKVVTLLADLKERYSCEAVVDVGSQKMMMNVQYDAKLTTEAWATNAEFELKMIEAGHESHNQMTALPTMQRMAFSMLKMSTLMAATRREPDPDTNELEVTADDVRQAAFYIQKWAPYAIDLVTNAGRPSTEKILDRILTFIKDHPGVLRSTIMQRFRLNSRDMRDVLDTLVGRGQVVVKQTSNGGMSLTSTE